MNPEVKQQFKKYYQEMFAAIQDGRREEADRLRVLMEGLRLSQISDQQFVPQNLHLLPLFVQRTLNKNQIEIGVAEGSNCINAVFNYHNEVAVFAPLTTMQFLNRVRSGFVQLDTKENLKTGDLVVLWSRNGDQWRDRKILVKDLCPEAPGFPFGLVFDHVAVFVGENKLYHKPDPALTSRYQINDWDEVVRFNELLDGFEVTFHRKI